MRQGGGVARAVAARLAAGLLLAAGLAGCSTTPPSGGLPGDAPPARFGTVVVSEGDTGRRIVVKPGDLIEIRLASRPGRGYAIRLGSVVEPVLSLFGPVRYVDDTERQMRDGATNLEVWRFRAIQAGEVTVRFDYRRAWEGTGPVANHVEFPVVVR